MVEGTASATGERFFQSLVEHLAAAMNVRYALVAEFAGDMRGRTLAYWKHGALGDNVEWDLRGTPCEEVVKGNLCHHPRGIMQAFPHDDVLVQWKIQSYMGVPLRAMDGRHLGHLAVFDQNEMPQEPRKLFIFRIFAARAAAELERLRAEKLLRDSEERYRDLFEEAPCAYVYADAAGLLQRVNRRTAQLLGYGADALVGTGILDYIAGDAGSRAKAREWLAQFSAGAGSQGIELEMKRKDGSPLWVAIWDRPEREPGGKVAGGRSMWIDITDRVLMERERARLEQQNLYLQEEIQSGHNFQEIVGQGPALATVLGHVRRVAPTDASVLIWGETGTGKELFARAIHSASQRRTKPLIKVNCAALPAGLVESELFGHERGAFSGAIARRVGRFELARGGTIFLDEIGEVPPEVQVKLLRVLQEREFERVGGNEPIQAEVRVIAATNRDLLKAVGAGTFREDLYYRLNVFPIHLPPLRQRKEDIPLLVQFLTEKFRTRIGKRLEGVSNDTMQRLVAYPWPGNVRELENVLERAVILASGAVLEVGPELLPKSAAESTPAPHAAAPSAPSSTSLEAVEREHIQAVLKQTAWVIEGPNGAARILNIHPNTLRSRLKRLNIHRDAHGPS